MCSTCSKPLEAVPNFLHVSFADLQVTSSKGRAPSKGMGRCIQHMSHVFLIGFDLPRLDPLTFFGKPLPMQYVRVIFREKSPLVIEALVVALQNGEATVHSHFVGVDFVWTHILKNMY